MKASKKLVFWIGVFAIGAIQLAGLVTTVAGKIMGRQSVTIAAASTGNTFRKAPRVG